MTRGLALRAPHEIWGSAVARDTLRVSTFAWGLCAVLSLFLLPGNLLFELGIGYDVPESNAALKIHPSTYLSAIGVMLALAAVYQRKTVPGLAHWRMPIVFIVVISVCALSSFLSVGLASSSNYIDTFLAAGLLAMVVATGDSRQHRMLGYFIIAAVVANIVLSFWESVTEIHLIPMHISTFDLTKVEGNEGSDFRPAALYSHPLVASTVTSMSVFVVLAMRLRLWLAGIVVALLAAGLLSFGGRASLVTTGAVLFVAGSLFIAVKLVRRQMSPRIIMCTLSAIVLLPLLLTTLGTGTNIGNRLVTHFYVDDSAMARAQQWDVLERLDLREILYGTTRDRVEVLRSQIGLRANNLGFENPWLLLFLNLGIVNLLPFVFGMALFLTDLARRAGWPLGWMLVGSYLLIASTNNSLGVKAPDLSFLVAFAFAMSGFRNQQDSTRSGMKSGPESPVPVFDVNRAMVTRRPGSVRAPGIG